MLSAWAATGIGFEATSTVAMSTSAGNPIKRAILCIFVSPWKKVRDSPCPFYWEIPADSCQSSVHFLLLYAPRKLEQRRRDIFSLHFRQLHPIALFPFGIVDHPDGNAGKVAPLPPRVLLDPEERHALFRELLHEIADIVEDLELFRAEIELPRVGRPDLLFLLLPEISVIPVADPPVHLDAGGHLFVDGPRRLLRHPVLHHRFHHFPFFGRDILHLLLLRLHRLVHPALQLLHILPGHFRVRPLLVVSHPEQLPVAAKDEHLVPAASFGFRPHAVLPHVHRRRLLSGPAVGFLFVHHHHSAPGRRPEHARREDCARQIEMRLHRSPPLSPVSHKMSHFIRTVSTKRKSLSREELQPGERQSGHLRSQ